MKSSHCKTRWHNRCEVPECDCDCHPEEGSIVNDQRSSTAEQRLDQSQVGFLSGSDSRDHVIGNQDDLGSTPPAGHSPPSHPEPYDHGRYRVAEEPQGTDLNEPWVLDYCLECREPTWTHNARVAAKHETMCETCAYMLLSELTETRVRTENRVKPAINPFGTR